jgi:hypothetical protein
MQTYAEIDFEIDDVEYYDTEVEVNFSFTPGDPGRYYGLPEDCYPATDDEIEIESVTFEGREIYDHLPYVTTLMLTDVCRDYVEKARQACDE